MLLPSHVRGSGEPFDDKARSRALKAARARDLAPKLLLLLGSTLVCLAGLEVWLRYFNPLGQRVLGDQIKLQRNEDVAFNAHFEGEPSRVVRFRRNSLGFRGADPPPDLDEQLSIVAVGGSTTECLMLSEGESWPEVMGRRLGDSFPRLWVNNAGLDGHSTFGHKVLLDSHLLSLRPRVITFLIGINDLGRERRTGREYGRRVPLHLRLARHSALLATLVNLQRHWQAERAGLTHRRIDLRVPEILSDLPRIAPRSDLRKALIPYHRQRFLPGFRERVEELVETCTRHGILPVLITQPALYGHGVDPTTGIDLSRILIRDERRMHSAGLHGGLAWRLLEEYNDVTRDIAATARVPLVDLARSLPKDSRLFYDYFHLTRLGSERAGALVAEQLCPALQRGFPGHLAGTTCSVRTSGEPVPPQAGPRAGDSFAR